MMIAGTACPHCGSTCSRYLPAVLAAMALVACGDDGKTFVPPYGIADTTPVDADGDGYFSTETGGDDCDDTNKDIHPDADETPDDGVDSNCDGEDNP
jgi:hypothetical protein